MLRACFGLPLALLVLVACGSDTDTTTTGSGHGATGDAPCTAPDQCPGTDGECGTRTCSAGKCGIDPAPDGTPLKTDSVGDCKRRVCDGLGSTKDLPDDTDVKTDGKECTVDACTGGMPTNTAKPPGTACMDDGGRFCHTDGECRFCAEPSAACDDDGPGEPNETEATAADLGTVAASDVTGVTFCGVLKGATDVDWYRYSGTDDARTAPERAVTSASGVRLCKYIECTGMTTMVTCPSGTSKDTSPDGHAGCCGTKPFKLEPSADICPDGANDATVWIKIENQAKAACAGYQLDLHF